MGGFQNERMSEVREISSTYNLTCFGDERTGLVECFSPSLVHFLLENK